MLTLTNPRYLIVRLHDGEDLIEIASPFMGNESIISRDSLELIELRIG